MEKVIKKITASLLLSILLISSTYADDLTEVDTRLDNMRASSLSMWTFWEILTKVFDTNWKIKSIFYDFVNMTVWYIPYLNSSWNFVNSPISTNGTNVTISWNLTANTLFENWTSLVSKYLWIWSKAADSNLLDWLDSLAFQKRVSNVCAAWSSMRTINSDGTVVCEVDDGATVNSNNYITKSNGTSFVNSLMYDNGTNVWIWTTAPSRTLDVAWEIRVGNTSSTQIILEDDESPNWIKYIHANGNNVWFLSGGYSWLARWDNSGNQINTWNITATAFIYSSDKRLKKNISTLDNSLENINKLRWVSFDWKKSWEREIWLIAQEVEKVYPDLVVTDNNWMKAVKYGNIVAILIEGVKGLYTKVVWNSEDIKELKIENKKLENKVNDLEFKMKKLEDKIDKLTK